MGGRGEQHLHKISVVLRQLQQSHSLVLLVCKICPRYKRDLQRADGTYVENNARYCEREVAGGAINVHKLAGGACKATTGSKQPKSKSSN